MPNEARDLLCDACVVAAEAIIGIYILHKNHYCPFFVKIEIKSILDKVASFKFLFRFVSYRSKRRAN